MDAKQGDHLVVENTIVGAARREGEIVEVVEAGRLYRVRWSDGHESVLSPGGDTHVVPR